MKKLLIIITLSLLALDAFAQRRVSGTIVDNERNEPLIGAAVMERGTARGVTANLDGWFEFTTSRDSAELIISAVGMLTENIKITSDTIVTIILEEAPPMFHDRPFILRTTTMLGVNADIVNSLFGVSFAQFRGRFSYGVCAQTGFNRDYVFAGNVRFRPPLRRVGELSLNYTHKNLSENTDFNFHQISIKGSTRAWDSRFRLEYFIEPAFQWLNDKNNLGLIMGLNRNFGLPSRRVHNLDVGLSAGYFSDYWTYSAGAHFHISRNFGLRFIYNRIDNHDFFNVGLTYRFR